MPTFDFRLEAQDGSGHYRQGAGSFESEEEARVYLNQKERGASDYRLTTAQLAELAAVALPGGDANDQEALAERLVSEGLAMDDLQTFPPRVRAAVATHHQAKPYKLVKLSERKEG